MRNSSVLKRILSTEELDDTSPQPIPEAEQGEMPSIELDLQTEVTEDNIDRAEINAHNETCAALEGYREQLRHLIATKQCTPVTEALISMGIDNALAKYRQSTVSISNESFSDEQDIIRRHELILESISQEGYFNRLGQKAVMYFKHHVNAVTDLFRSTSSQVRKYRAKLAETRDEYKENAGRLRGMVDVSQTELWYHFSNERGPIQRDQLMPAMKLDVEMSNFVLDTYPKKVLETAFKAINLIKSADTKTPAGVLKLAQAIEKLPSAADLFDKKYLEHTFFSVKHFEVDHGTSVKARTLNNVTLSSLAELSQTDIVTQGGSNHHTGKKAAGYYLDGVLTVGYPLIGGAATGVTAKFNGEFQVKADDIGKILDAGEQYLKNVEGYLKLESEYKKVCDQCDSIFTDPNSGTWEGLTGDADKVADQIEQYVVNLMLFAFESPAKAELARSLKSAKYNMYLANRALHNAAN